MKFGLQWHCNKGWYIAMWAGLLACVSMVVVCPLLFGWVGWFVGILWLPITYLVAHDLYKGW